MRSVENRASRTRGKSRNVSRYRGSLYWYITMSTVTAVRVVHRNPRSSSTWYKVPGILYLSRPRKSILFLARKLKDSNRQNDVQHVYFENGEVGTSCVSIPPLGSAVRIGRRWLPLWHNEQTGDGIYRETERFSRPRQPPKFSGGFVLQS